MDVARLNSKFLFDIPYATENNFFGQRVYPEARCLLLESVAKRVVRAQEWLDTHHEGLRLLFKDCYRPDHVQRVMWNAVKGTKKAGYVANPHSATGSIHSYGAAVDVTLADIEGRELDMGTPHDYLGRLAEPRRELEFLAAGTLNKAQVERRKILRRAMVEGAKMRSIPNEWWHFDADRAAVIRAQYPRLDVPFSTVP